jgi:CheY-like chemotaxis protein
MIQQAKIIDIDTAQNGYDGFQLVLNKQYNFIVCDLEMPVMNGYECAQKIKAKYEQKQDFFSLKKSQEEEDECPLLIACSALINPQIEKKALDHGFDFAV